MATFFSRLSYSLGNEDWATEQEALQIKPQDRILCITASGDRPLNLLLNPCQNLVSIDANKIQNYLLDLKVIAMQQLDYDHYLSFLGVQPDLHRSKKLKALASHMPRESSQFWLKNEKLIEKGILYQGAIERLTKKASIIFSLLKQDKINKLFAINDLEEQKIFIQQHWNTPFLKKVFEWILNPFLTKLFLHDPGLYDHVNNSIKPGTYIYNRMHASLNRYLAKENPLLSLILKGEIFQEAFPPYLTQQGTEIIKKRLGCLSIHTADIVDYVESSPEASFDCFSLSDVASYLKYEDFVRLLKGVHKAAKPGARFSIRQFLSFHEIPLELRPYFKRDSALEECLEKKDRCFVYRFMVGQVVKDSQSCYIDS